jgi:hypothetical protein
VPNLTYNSTYKAVSVTLVEACSAQITTILDFQRRRMSVKGRPFELAGMVLYIGGAATIVAFTEARQRCSRFRQSENS